MFFLIMHSYLSQMDFLSIRQVHFRFRIVGVLFLNFIQMLMEHFVSKINSGGSDQTPYNA